MWWGDFFIIFSPTGKPYSFGHPSVEFVAKHFFNVSQPLNETIDAPVEAYYKGALRTRQMFSRVYQLDLCHEGQEDFTYFLNAMRMSFLPFLLDMALVSN
ncbi:hypothetical protein Goari_004593, partial [Gossypium aridum]|nr:hypothetical protein [Gossypium aridum]